jgi:DNA transformation protein and related proteins
VEFVKEQLAAFGTITARAMFGGWCVYCDGVVFGLIANDTLYLKADTVNRPDFEAACLPAFRPFDDQPTVMSYYLAPPEIFEHAAVRTRWVGGAIEAGRRGVKPKRRR